MQAPLDRLARVRHVALDMDGTVYRGSTLFDFTKPFLRRLGDLGIGHTFLTNNSSKSVAEYVRHLRRFGIEATADQVYTSTHAAVAHLKAALPDVRSLYVLGTPGMAGELADAGYAVVEDEPDAVVVGFDTGLTFERLCRAAYWVGRGRPFVASHPDAFCPTDLPTVLVDCGAVCAAIATATGRGPDAVVGKPDPYMLTSLAARHGLRPDEMAMAGDRLHTDVLMARRAGAVGVLVLTGESTSEQAAACAEPPDLVLPSLAELGELLSRTREVSAS